MTYFNLEQRTETFCIKVRRYLKSIPRSLMNEDDIKQAIRSSGSVTANYCEANDAIGKGDFLMRIRIARKEAKETAIWLRLIENEEKDEEIKKELLQEAKELVCIFSAIIKKATKK